ncbi:MAG: phage portal protein [Phycisphaerae bacterium]|nr:phage portal protein [Phycisphaerae bacterium]
MAYRLTPFAPLGLDEPLLTLLLDQHHASTLPRLDKLWTYFRNPLTPASRASARGWYRQGQEIGLPPRVLGDPALALDDRAVLRREVVIENDIAWRIQAMVDFIFGKPLTIVSTAATESKRRLIERILDRVWEQSGGVALLQDMALLAHVFGHVDLVVRAASHHAAPVDPSDPHALDKLLPILDDIRVELIDPRRGVPLTSPRDYRDLSAYLINVEHATNTVEPTTTSPLSIIRRAWQGATQSPGERRRASTLEVISADRRQLYHDGRLVLDEDLGWSQGRIPVVHIQNIAQPFHYSGLSDVEPLIPLQDELNTRLSDRACRVTMQSFKMYLAKGLEGFDTAPVAPGQLWTTDNPDASISEFGGDASCPSEDAHIEGVREAFDKVSGIPPLAGGVVRAKVGNLSSANALRITLMGVLAKTQRKRVTYGRGIAQASALILAALDHAGALSTTEEERAVRLEWSDPLPEDITRQVQAAQGKVDLGVPRERVLAELGYAPGDPGIG